MQVPHAPGRQQPSPSTPQCRRTRGSASAGSTQKAAWPTEPWPRASPPPKARRAHHGDARPTSRRSQLHGGGPPSPPHPASGTRPALAAPMRPRPGRDSRPHPHLRGRRGAPHERARRASGNATSMTPHAPPRASPTGASSTQHAGRRCAPATGPTPSRRGSRLCLTPRRRPSRHSATGAWSDNAAPETTGSRMAALADRLMRNGVGNETQQRSMRASSEARRTPYSSRCCTRVKPCGITSANSLNNRANSPAETSSTKSWCPGVL